MSSFLSTMASFALRLLLAVISVVMVAVLISVALATILGLMLWSLLRGRRPGIDLSGLRRARQFRAGSGMHGRRSPPGEVVDVEVREVKPAPTRLDA